LTTIADSEKADFQFLTQTGIFKSLQKQSFFVIISLVFILKGEPFMIYSHDVEKMCIVAKGTNNGPAPIPEEGKWVKAYDIKDISGFSHGVGWCAPQQGACKLSLNVKNGIVEEALVETLGCTGMTHSAAMASEILPGKTLLECLNTDLVCDAINVAMREIFLQFVYGRSQSAFSEGGLPVGSALEDLGKGLRSVTATMFSTKAKGARYMEIAEGYVTRMGLDGDDRVIGYEFIRLGKMLEDIRHGVPADEALNNNKGTYGCFADAVKYIDPREE
jgi:NifU-like protein involved in Fe-S cluster formation